MSAARDQERMQRRASADPMGSGGKQSGGVKQATKNFSLNANLPTLARGSINYKQHNSTSDNLSRSSRGERLDRSSGQRKRKPVLLATRYAAESAADSGSSCSKMSTGDTRTRNRSLLSKVKLKWNWYDPSTAPASGNLPSYTEEINRLYLTSAAIAINPSDIYLDTSEIRYNYLNKYGIEKFKSSDPSYKESNENLIRKMLRNSSYGSLITETNLVDLKKQVSTTLNVNDFQEINSVLKKKIINNKPNIIAEFSSMQKSLEKDLVVLPIKESEVQAPDSKNWTPVIISMQNLIIPEELNNHIFLTFTLISKAPNTDYKYASEEFTLGADNRAKRCIFIPNKEKCSLILKMYRRLQLISEEMILKCKSKQKYTYSEEKKSNDPDQILLMPFCWGSVEVIRHKNDRHSLLQNMRDNSEMTLHYKDFLPLFDKSDNDLVSESSEFSKEEKNTQSQRMISKGLKNHFININCSATMSLNPTQSIPNDYIMPINYDKSLFYHNRHAIYLNIEELTLMKDLKNMQVSVSVYDQSKFARCIKDPFNRNRKLREYIFPTIHKRVKFSKYNSMIEIDLQGLNLDNCFLVFHVSEIKSLNSGRDIYHITALKLWSSDCDFKNNTISLRLQPYMNSMPSNMTNYQSISDIATAEDARNRNIIKVRLNLVSNIHPANRYAKLAFQSLDEKKVDLLTRSKVFIKNILLFLQIGNWTEICDEFSVTINKILDLMNMSSSYFDASRQNVYLFTILHYVDKLFTIKQQYGSNVEDRIKMLIIHFSKYSLRTRNPQRTSQKSGFAAIIQNSVDYTEKSKISPEFCIAETIVNVYADVEAISGTISKRLKAEFAETISPQSIKNTLMKHKYFSNLIFVKDLYVMELNRMESIKNWPKASNDFLCDLTIFSLKTSENLMEQSISKCSTNLLQHWMLFDNDTFFYSSVSQFINRISNMLDMDKYVENCIVFCVPILISHKYARSISSMSDDYEKTRPILLLEFFIKVIHRYLKEKNAGERPKPSIQTGFKACIIFLNHLILMKDANDYLLNKIFLLMHPMIIDLLEILKKSQATDKINDCLLMLYITLFHKNIIHQDNEDVMKYIILFENIIKNTKNEFLKNNNMLSLVSTTSAADTNALTLIPINSNSKPGTNSESRSGGKNQSHTLTTYLSKLYQDIQCASLMFISTLLHANKMSTGGDNHLLCLGIINFIDFLFDFTDNGNIKASCIELMALTEDDAFLASDRLYGTKKNPKKTKFSHSSGYVLHYSTQVYQIIISLGSSVAELRFIAIKTFDSLLYRLIDTKNSLSKELYEVSIYSAVVNIILDIKNNKIVTDISLLLTALFAFQEKIQSIKEIRSVHIKMIEIISVTIDLISNLYYLTNVDFKSDIIYYLISNFSKRLKNYPEIRYFLLNYLSGILDSARLQTEKGMCHLHQAALVSSFLDVCDAKQSIETDSSSLSNLTHNIFEEAMAILWKPSIENYYQFPRKKIFEIGNVVEHLRMASESFRSTNNISLCIKATQCIINIQIKLGKYHKCLDLYSKMVDKESQIIKYNYLLSKFYLLTLKSTTDDSFSRNFIVRSDHPGSFITQIKEDLKRFGVSKPKRDGKNTVQTVDLSYIQLKKDSRNHEKYLYRNNSEDKDIFSKYFYSISYGEQNKSKGANEMPKYKLRHFDASNIYPYKTNIMDIHLISETFIDEIHARLMDLDSNIDEMQNKLKNGDSPQIADEVKQIVFEDKNIITCSITTLEQYTVNDEMKNLILSKVLKLMKILSEMIGKLGEVGKQFSNDYEKILRQVNKFMNTC
ncbi:MAG: hypothetical protein MHMPM18_001406 [Marteilia pararefringens]